MYGDFELQGIDEERLNSKIYQTITRRMQLEETNCALNENSTGSGGVSLRAFPERQERRASPSFSASSNSHFSSMPELFRSSNVP